MLRTPGPRETAGVVRPPRPSPAAPLRPHRTARRRPTDPLLGALAVVVAVALLVGCTGAGEAEPDPGPGPVETTPTTVPDPGPVAGGDLVVGVGEDPTGLSPAAGPWTPSQRQLGVAVFDTLTALDAAGTAQPWLAEALTSEAAGQRWTIHLRPGVTFHDGQPLTAAAVRDHLEALRVAPLTAPTLAPVAVVEAPSDLEVVVSMHRPWVDFPTTLATEVGAVASPAWLQGGDPVRPVGTGPFQVVAWEPGRQVVLARNASWWRQDTDGRALPLLDEVRLVVVPDAGARLAKLAAGQLDLITTTSAHALDQLDDLVADEEEPPVQVVPAPPTETAETFVQLNTAAPPFDRTAARQALVLATDAAQVADEVHEDLEATGGPHGPASPWAADATDAPFDPGAAEALLEDGASTDGDPLAFTIVGTEDPSSLATLLLLEERWREQGIQPRLELVSPAELRRRAAVGDYQALLRTQIDSSIPAEDAVAWHPATITPLGQPGTNATRFADPSLAAWLDALAAADEVEDRFSLQASIQSALAAGAAHVWLYHAPVAVAAAPLLGGLSVTEDGSDGAGDSSDGSPAEEGAAVEEASAAAGGPTLPDGEPAMVVRGGAVPLDQLWWRSGP
jgi:peptide/nickel transport system substrate-binding protein